MDTISSAEFRKTYAKLTEATVVTVNGHMIGEWRPLTFVQHVIREAGLTVPEAQAFAERATGFNSRPFTPVPKTK